MPFLTKIVKSPFVGIIKFYQFAISPLFGPSCRHYPTCSNYAIEAIEVHGVIKGIWLSARRVVKCNPWGTSGFDPVPHKLKNP